MTVNDFATSAVTPRPSDDTGWRTASECRKHPTRWWFGGGHQETMQAKGICAACPVKGPCLEFALSRPDLLGIWAETTPNERASLRRSRRPRPADADDGFEAAPAATPGVSAGERHEHGGSSTEPALTAVGSEFREVAVEMGPEAGLEISTGPQSDPEADHVRLAPVAGRPAVRTGRGPEGVVVECDELLTPAEAAHRLGVTPNTVTRWSRAGKIPAIQTMGGHRRFRRSEIERVLHAAGPGNSTPI